MRPLFTFVLVLVIAATVAARQNNDLRVLGESSGSITVEFTPRFTTRLVLGKDGRRYTRFDFPGADYDRSEQGAPLTAYRPVLLTLPSRQYTVQILTQEFDDSANVEAATIPAYQANKDFGFSAVYSAPLPKYVTPDRIPLHIAQLTNVHESRGLLLGTLKLYPYQVAVARNEARLYRRIVVRIDFAGARAGSPASSLFLKNSFPTYLEQAQPVKAEGIQSDSPLAQGEWIRMEVQQSGIYKIDQTFLTKAGISLSAIGNINSIRIFGSGGSELPEDLNAPRNGFGEIARLVVDKNGNGTFDAEDFILFYGQSTRGWTYSPGEGTFHHFINNYTETSIYFLTYGGSGRGKDMAALPSTNVAGLTSQADFQEKTFVEHELHNLVNSGRQWVGESFDINNPTNSFTTSLTGVVSTKPVVYRFKFFSRSSSDESFVVQENSQALGDPIPTSGIDVSPSSFYEEAYEAPVTEYQRTGALPNDRSVLRMSYPTRNSAAVGWLDWFEILYRRRFEANNDSLYFTSPDGSGTMQYTISKFSSRDVYVFDVSAYNAAQQVTNLTYDQADASVVTFQLSQTPGSVRWIAAVGPNGFRVPANPQKVLNSNLHGNISGAKFVIFSPPDFITEAQRLASYRQAHDQLSSVVVNLDQVFNEFSSGMVDPMAIRDFLRYALTTWTTKPGYVLLFGGGNFDYKNILTTEKNWVPPYETVESNFQLETLASDDYFVFLDPSADPSSPFISLPIGRLPVRSLQQAQIMVDKIISYETGATFDSWRNHITIVADDGLTTNGDDGTIHTDQANTLADQFTPDKYEKEKIYLVEYPTVNTSTGRTKPGVNQAIDAAINRGTVILNWTGHGNTLQWAHENVFNIEQDFPLIANKGKLFFLVAATCDYARYDYLPQAGTVSAGEQLLLMQDRGAVAEVTADRVVISQANAALNQQLYTNLLGATDSAGLPVRLGDAMWATKQVQNSPNDQKHHLLGDPTMRLDVPRGLVSIDSINGQNPLSLVTFGALSKVRLNGTAKSPAGGAKFPAQGRALIEVFDAKRQVLAPDWPNYYFSVNGSLLYRGEVTIRNGVLQGVFPIPKDVSYGANNARIGIYAWSDSTDATGYTENVSINGTAPATIDTSGPTLRIYFDDQSFHTGDIVGPNPLLIVELTDSSGINTSTAGIGHKLEASLDASPHTIDLTDSYRGNLDTYQSGEVRYQLSSLAEGRHTLSVKAWDIYNNSSTTETYFEVRSTSQLAIYNLFNIPNPFTRSTTFTFQRSTTDPIDVEVKIYTVAGRLIQVLDASSVIDRLVRVPWDGRDHDGNEIANGVYLYHVIAKSLDKTSSTEALGKLAVMR